MNNNLIALLASFVLIGLIISLSFILEKINLISKEGSRKLIHIGVSNWWFIYMFLFTNMWLAIIPPIIFIVFNYLSYRLKIIKTMQRDENDTLGTIYYPVSLLIAVVISSLTKDVVLPGIAILVLGYGDGLAALVGSKIKSKKINDNKSLIGSLTMFVVTFLITLIFIIISYDISILSVIFISIVTGLLAMTLELYTKNGLDNLTIPLGVMVFLYLIFYLIKEVNMISFIIGFSLSLVIAFVAYLKKALTLSGFIASVIVGTLIYFFGTYIIFTLLMFFFITSSGFTKYEGNKNERTGRNYIQVIVNAFAALLFSTLYYFLNDSIYLILASIGIAASTSDTWASEIGKKTTGRTVSILDFKTMKKGESGGISLLGTVSALFGSLFIALIFVSLVKISNIEITNIYIYIIIITLAGFIGNIFDSYFGILLQEKYYDEEKNLIVEKRNEKKDNGKVSGFKYINNDVVNVVSSLGITLIFWVLIILL